MASFAWWLKCLHLSISKYVVLSYTSTIFTLHPFFQINHVCSVLMSALAICRHNRHGILSLIMSKPRHQKTNLIGQSKRLHTLYKPWPSMAREDNSWEELACCIAGGSTSLLGSSSLQEENTEESKDARHCTPLLDSFSCLNTVTWCNAQLFTSCLNTDV